MNRCFSFGLISKIVSKKSHNIISTWSKNYHPLLLVKNGKIIAITEKKLKHLKFWRDAKIIV